MAKAQSAKHNGRLLRVFDEVLGGFEVEMSEAQAIALSKVPEIAGVHEVPVAELTIAEPANSWGRDRVDQRPLPFDSTYNYYYTGQNVVVYVIDSGVNDVGDIAGRINARADFTLTGILNDCVPPNGHGTLVASTIGETTYGVARDVRFVSLKAADCNGNGNGGNIIAALNWMVQNRPVGELSVANVSLRVAADQNVDIAVRDAIAAGITVVVGAGNNGGDACQSSPARAGNAGQIPNNPNGLSAITVAASDQGDHVAWWQAGVSSNTGPCVDIFAPGGPGLTAHGTSYVDTAWSGTSAASPHAAGMAALALQKFGAIEPGMVETTLRENATTNVITNNPNGLANLLPGTPNLLLYHVTIPSRIRACCY